jgi:hypothetical protein
MGPQWKVINIARRHVETTRDAECVEPPMHENTLPKLKQPRLKYANMSSYVDIWIFDSRKRLLHLNL